MTTENQQIPRAPYELGPFRPPSEAYSLLLRLTRNCPWNRCRFCGMYKGLKFELRPVEDIKNDIQTAAQIRDEIAQLARVKGYGSNIRKAAAMVLNNPPNFIYQNVALWLYSGGQNVFLQDANSLQMRTPELLEVLKFLKETLPTINRITSYCRAKTAAQKKPEELKAIHEAGLTRLHVGLESGSDTVLKLMEKGVTAAEEIEGGKKVVAAGISLSEYYLLGLGGKSLWREHAIESARVLNAIDPDFIRIRTLSVNERLLMWADVESGSFVRTTDEEMMEELKLFIQNLDCHANFVSDHIGNLLQDVEGKLPEDKEKMLAVIERFQALTPSERQVFRIGRRARYYNGLDDLGDAQRRDIVEQIINRVSHGTGAVDEEIVYKMRELQ
ncbi:MAG: radical SAM protein [Dehalococcoidales bacterium]|nr:radical SAM protein [Dehalococcoidales bacterium]